MTDKYLGGLVVRVFTQNVRGIRFDSHPRLNFSVISDVQKNIKLLLNRLGIA